jgi:glycosyltransferase domain-containing protein
MDESAPLVTIAIPTYDRRQTLERTLESARGQTYPHLEIVISDNASADDTEALCRSVAAEDPRIRYLRQTENRGPTENFNTLFAAARGELVMMLADDDWIDPDYVERCAAELQARPDHALVAGRARYYRDGNHVHDGVEMQLLDARPDRRVRDYYARVDDNGTFYGVMRTASLRAAAPLRNVLGNDWHLIAGVAFTGKVRTLASPAIHRELDGTSVGIDRILETFGSRPAQARIPHLVMAWHAFADVAWRHPLYRRLSLAGRIRTGVCGGWALIRWRSLAYHLLGPPVVRLGRRRRLHWLALALSRAKRRWGDDPAE